MESITCACVLIVLAAVSLSAPAQAQYYGSVLTPDDQARLDALRRSQGEQDAKHAAEMKALRAKLLRSAPLPDERNVLLGSWRLEGGGAGAGLNETMGKAAAYKGTGGPGAGLGELFGMMANMNPEKMLCEASFGDGITFRPSTYSSNGVAGIAGGPIAYRSGAKGYIVAIPADTRANMMPFEIAGPNRIRWGDTCALVRVGAPAASAAVNSSGATRAPAAASASGQASPTLNTSDLQVASAAPTAGSSRPSPEVCRNTLLDKLGTVGINQVRAMSDARFKEPAIEGKVPNTNNLRIDLRGSACDDPRIKATLYDFDANGMLQSITYVWARPPGAAPAPIFSERIATLSRFHSLPPPQSQGRLQADTSLGRLILEDLPERNLLLEAYKAPK